MYHKCGSYDIWFLKYKVPQKKYLSFWAIFRSFNPLTNQKIKISKSKKTPGDAIILHICTINGNLLMDGSWDMERDRIFCHCGLFFALFPIYGPIKLKFWKNEKNAWRYYHFTNINDSHMVNGSSDMECKGQNFCHLNCFLLFYPQATRKMKFLKKGKNAWRYYNFTHVYHKWQSYDVWFLKYRVRQTEFFVILDHFLPF